MFRSIERLLRRLYAYLLVGFEISLQSLAHANSFRSGFLQSIHEWPELAQTQLESGQLELEDFESRSKKFNSFDSSFIQNLQKIHLHLSPLLIKVAIDKLRATRTQPLFLQGVCADANDIICCPAPVLPS